jgi:hypothetical protein
MKRVATWVFYGVGAISIAYLALYAYAVFTGRDLQPGDPIHIFRKPDAPSYSQGPSFRGDAKHQTMVRNCAPENLEFPRCAIAHLRSGPSRNDRDGHRRFAS